MNDFCHSPDAPDDCPGRLVCHCLQVTEADLVTALNVLEIRTVQDIRRHTGAGDGCNACHKTLGRYLERHGCSAGTADLAAAV